MDVPQREYRALVKLKIAVDRLDAVARSDLRQPENQGAARAVIRAVLRLNGEADRVIRDETTR